MVCLKKLKPGDFTSRLPRSSTDRWSVLAGSYRINATKNCKTRISLNDERSYSALRGVPGRFDTSSPASFRLRAG